MCHKQALQKVWIRHHQSLCEVKSNHNDKSKEMPTDSSNQDVTVNNVSRSKSRVLLKIARTYTYAANKELVPVRVLLDSGSQRLYVSQELKSRLGSEVLIRNLNTFRNENFSK